MAVRIAVANDLPATARIAFKGFSLSPWNKFYRPHADKFPADVENSYLLEQQEALADNKKLFTVFEVDGSSASSKEKEVVGFAIWNLSSSQKPRAQPVSVAFTTKQGSCDYSKNSENRSVDEFRAELLFPTTAFAVQQYLKDFMELDNMAVDPDHFRRGYGSLLCRYGMAVANEDKVSVGLIAAASGKPLYDHLGFQTVVRMTLGDERAGSEAEVDFWVQRYPSAKLA